MSEQKIGKLVQVNPGRVLSDRDIEMLGYVVRQGENGPEYFQKIETSPEFEAQKAEMGTPEQVASFPLTRRS